MTVAKLRDTITKVPSVKCVNLWWSKSPKPGNFGDCLSPLILNALGYRIKPVNIYSPEKFIAIGSTAKYIQKRDTVWGTGIMNSADIPEKNARYLAVRGPLTGDKVQCAVYGDPGLLCSYLWPRGAQDTSMNKIALVPHYVDYQAASEIGMDKINVLNSNPLDVISALIKYQGVISSSLHGIIVAHSYGIPAGWWQPSNKLDGDGSKFYDYALSVGIQLQPETSYTKVKLVLPSPEMIKQVQTALLNTLNNY
jgi:pyruvyltransferase